MSDLMISDILAACVHFSKFTIGHSPLTILFLNAPEHSATMLRLLRKHNKIIITFLVIDDKNDEHANRHAYSYAKDVDKTKSLIPEKISQGSFKIVVDHERLYLS